MAASSVAARADDDLIDHRADNFDGSLLRASRARPALRKRLWQAAFALGLFVAIAAAMNPFLPADKAVSRRSAGHDFLAFYTAGTFVRTGRARELYDLAAVRAFEHRVAQEQGLELPPGEIGPYWNPPLLAILFVPLSAMPYPAALDAWIALNLLCFAGAMWILCLLVARVCNPCFARREDTGWKPVPGENNHASVDWRTWALLPLLTLTSIPFIEAIGHGQNTCISLLIVAAAVALWRQNRGLAAGAVVGLLFYKPQLSAVLAAALVLTCGWRAIAGLATTGAAVLLATLLALPGTLGDFLRKLPENVRYMQVEHRYLWDRHVTLKAFWRLLVDGFAVGESSPPAQQLYVLSLACAAAFLLGMIWKLRRRSDALSRDRLIAATIVAMPLLMPFYFDYDLLLLAVPAALLAREAAAGDEPLDRRLVAAWAALYAWLIVNAAAASASHVNGTVVLLSLLAAMMIRRAVQPATAQRAVETPAPPTTVRRAA